MMLATRASAVRIAGVVAAALLAAACSTAGSGGSQTATEITSARGHEAQRAVDELVTGVFDRVPTNGPGAVTGANVWLISCGQAYEACSTNSSAFEQAGAALSWKVTVYDGKADPNVASDGIRQAIAAGARAVVVQSFDCSGIRNALVEARNAGVLTIASQSADCNVPEIGGQAEFTAGVSLRGDPTSLDFYAKWGASKADYLIARTDAQAKVIELRNTDQLLHRHQATGFETEMATCGTCSTVQTIDFSFADVSSGVLAQTLQSALLQHPEANAVFIPFDALYGLGLSNALAQSGRTDVINLGGEGFAPNMDLIRNGQQTASMALSFGWIGYAAADTTNRLLAGAHPADLPSEGLGYQLVDKDHNLPAAGQSYQPPIDYAADFKRLWTTRS